MKIPINELNEYYEWISEYIISNNYDITPEEKDKFFTEIINNLTKDPRYFEDYEIKSFLCIKMSGEADLKRLNKELDKIMENHYKRINAEESAHQSSQ